MLKMSHFIKKIRMASHLLSGTHLTCMTRSKYFSKWMCFVHFWDSWLLSQTTITPWHASRPIKRDNWSNIGAINQTSKAYHSAVPNTLCHHSTPYTYTAQCCENGCQVPNLALCKLAWHLAKNVWHLATFSLLRKPILWGLWILAPGNSRVPNWIFFVALGKKWDRNTELSRAAFICPYKHAKWDNPAFTTEIHVYSLVYGIVSIHTLFVLNEVRWSRWLISHFPTPEPCTADSHIICIDMQMRRE